MNYTAYQEYQDQILNRIHTATPYDNEEYYHYAKLNITRSTRWDKTAVITSENQAILDQLTKPLQFILITEPWCGDAAHIVPVIAKIAEASPLIALDIQLRDSEPFLIDQYLTNGGKSIPILVIRDEHGTDLAVWGPRPEGAATLFASLKQQNAIFDDIKTALQKWYNNDATLSVQNEIVALIKNF